MSLKVPDRELTTEDSDLAKFNHNLSLLIYQLSKAYPEDRDLKVYADKFEWSKRFNARMACEYFVYVIHPYIKEIMQEDESFFLDLDYTKTTENERYLELIYKIVDVWKHSENKKLKKNVWRYFQILLTYSIKAMRRRDLADVLNKYRETPLII